MAVINLLPPEQKKEYRAARVNTILRRYLNTTLVAFVAVIGVFGFSLYINMMNRQAHNQQLAESQAKLESFKDVRDKTKAFNANLKQAKQIFAQELRLSQVIATLSSTLPPGVVLNSVALDSQQLKDPLNIVAQLDSFEKAGVLKRNFEESGAFASVVLKDVTGIPEAETGEGTSPGGEEATVNPYPFTANLEVTLAPTLGAVKPEQTP